MDEPSTQPLMQKLGPAAGGQVGRYRVDCFVGEGGMGVVYRATDTSLARSVALKFLTPDRVGDAEARTRFLREAQAAARLDHPNLGAVYDTGEWEGHPYIAFAFYEGETLASRLGRGAIGVPEAEGILRQIAQGLAAAHRAGIVHRDLKPANVMLASDGTVKILDFGLAKVAGPARARLTESGMVMGTVAYMSPEQASGGEVDHRTDLWSLGVIAYEMLTGTSPFDGGSATATLTRIMTAEPKPIESIARGAPARTCALVTRLLRKNRDERPATADVVLGHLSGTHTLRRVAGKRNVATPLFAVAAIAIGAGAYYVAHRAPAPSTRALSSSIVALPCKVIGPEDQRYLTDAIPSTLTTVLAQIADLDTRMPPTSEQWDPGKADLARIEKAYDVHQCLTCTVTASGSDLTLTLSIVKPDGKRVIWSKDYQGTTSGYLELARKGADGVRDVLLPRSTPVPTTPIPGLGSSGEVELMLQRARYHKNRYNNLHDPTELRKARDAYEQVLKVEPNLATVHAELGELSMFEMEASGEIAGLAEVEAAADRALALDPKCPNAWSVKAWIEMKRPRPDDARSSEYALRAAASGPVNGNPACMLGIRLAQAGALELSITAYAESSRQDPLYIHPRLNAFDACWQLGRGAENASFLKGALDLEPDAPFVVGERLVAVSELGIDDVTASKDLAAVERAVEEGRWVHRYALVYHLALATRNGDEARVRSLLGEISAWIDDPVATPFDLNGFLVPYAPVYLCRLGLAEEAVAILLRSHARGAWMPFDELTMNPALAPIRDDPRLAPIKERSLARLDDVLTALKAARGRGELPRYLEGPLDEALARRAAAL